MKYTLRYVQSLILIWTLLMPPASGSVSAGACPDEDAESGVTLALSAVAGVAPRIEAQELFARHLRRRGAVVSAADRLTYWRELKAKPELQHTPIHDAGSTQAQDVLKIIRPVLTLYKRDWDVAVIQQDAPFAGAFRQCIFIVSTGLLQLITEDELKSFAAHELAHECFIDELRAADRSHCLSAYHLVEFKCDLVAVLALLLVRADPLAVAAGVKRVEAYYLKHDPSVLREGTHPAPNRRRRCIELFLLRIAGASASRPYAELHNTRPVKTLLRRDVETAERQRQAKPRAQERRKQSFKP